MEGLSRSRRRTDRATLTGRARANVVAKRLGVALRDARLTAGMDQADVGVRAGTSQSLVSRLERGRGQTASIETWACVAAAVGEQVVGFLERAPGAMPPRDIEHLRRQSALIELAATGGWSALPEFAIDPDAFRSRSIDAALIRVAAREAIAGEIWDWFDDVGASLRSLDAKVEALARRLAEESAGHGQVSRTDTLRGGLDPGSGAGPMEPWRVRGLFVVRDTRRNRVLVAELRPLFAARFGGSSAAWLRALASAGSPLPDGHGLLWSDVRGRLSASRLGRVRVVGL